LESDVALGLLGAAHQSHLVDLKQGFEQIWSAVVEQVLNLVVAWILPESLVVEVSLVNLDWTSLVAQHELLEIQETPIVLEMEEIFYRYQESPSLSAMNLEKEEGV
jgi:hypothetical protein